MEESTEGSSWKELTSVWPFCEDAEDVGGCRALKGMEAAAWGCFGARRVDGRAFDAAEVEKVLTEFSEGS